MTWQAPWAWLGVIAVALPILIHLLGQGKARRLPFPSLQFFGATRPLPTRRTRLHDLLLLAVRMAILVAAVAALAQPLLLTAHRKSDFDGSLARAVIVDTSASMQRQTAAGERAIDVAMRRAHQLADSASPGIVLTTATPSGAIAGATEWLNRQPGQRELVIASDFQAGTVAPIDLKGVATEIGVRLDAIRPNVTDGPAVIHSRRGTEAITARVAHTGSRTDVDWSSAVGQAVPSEMVTTLTGPASARGVAAEQQWIAEYGLALPTDTARHIAIVYPDYSERAALLARTRPIRATWMSNAIASIHRFLPTNFRNPVNAADSGTLLVVARGFGEKPLILAGAADIDGRETLVLYSFADTGGHDLIRPSIDALSNASVVAESDPAMISDSELTTWQRNPAPRESPGPNADSSDGRWLWLLALLLLAIETLLRRAAPRPTAPETAPDAAS
jgi:hypothetical protein